MESTRRQFVLAAASTAAAACCSALVRAAAASDSTSSPTTSATFPRGVIDAGPLGDFKKDDVYDAFRTQGFFVIRRENKLLAMSSICTHKGCKVRVQDDLTFLCKCHGSTFDRDGNVTKGPAPRKLPQLAVAVDKNHHLLVDPNHKL